MATVREWQAAGDQSDKIDVPSPNEVVDMARADMKDAKSAYTPSIQFRLDVQGYLIKRPRRGTHTALARSSDSAFASASGAEPPRSRGRQRESPPRHESPESGASGLERPLDAPREWTVHT